MVAVLCELTERLGLAKCVDGSLVAKQPIFDLLDSDLW